MNYNVELTPIFKKEAKRLIKKYISLKLELESLFDKISETPALGIPLGNNIFKIRLSIASKRKGKSGGARIITYVLVSNETVYLLSIYDKSDQDDISDKKLQELIAKLYNKNDL
ncbi:MAG: type II toxin-antitoxin system RelE/ParE family toxin [Prevotellaceae bacterium]|jgi:mRNA-degrading endonuclease RelE of RelBE toxin-antitoxin system|nr:type II toxin-antitoxin system RelE/ParE family toxin [Prevotellaceae bacterium]